MADNQTMECLGTSREMKVLEWRKAIQGTNRGGGRGGMDTLATTINDTSLSPLDLHVLVHHLCAASVVRVRVGRELDRTGAVNVQSIVTTYPSAPDSRVSKSISESGFPFRVGIDAMVLVVSVLSVLVVVVVRVWSVEVLVRLGL